MTRNHDLGKIRHLRWYILGLIFLATIINYLDRMVWNVTQPYIGEIYQLSNTQLALIVLAFNLGYTLGPVPMGWFMDRVGTRRGYPFSMAFWSSAGVLTALAIPIGHALKSVVPFYVAPVILGFMVCRFVLGVGESGNWPVAIKSISEWFPARERSFAMGIFNSGSSVGATVAPALCLWLMAAFGWRATFVLVGIIGFLWIVGWIALYRPPSEHERITEEELNYITKSDSPDQVVQEVKIMRWTEVLKIRAVLGVLATRFFAEQVWWFCQTWIPTYYKQERNLDIKSLAIFTTLSFLSSDLGNIFGGWASSALIKLGWSVDRARKVVMLPCGLLMMSSLAVPFVGLHLAVALIALLTFCYQSWSVNMLTIPADVVPRRALASAAGLAHMAAGGAAILINLLTGKLSDLYGFTPVFLIIGADAMLAVVLLFVAVGRIDPYRRNEEDEPRSNC